MARLCGSGVPEASAGRVYRRGGRAQRRVAASIRGHEGGEAIVTPLSAWYWRLLGRAGIADGLAPCRVPHLRCVRNEVRV